MIEDVWAERRVEQIVAYHFRRFLLVELDERILQTISGL